MNGSVLFFLLFLLFTHNSNAQIWSPSGASSVSSGGIASTSTDIWSTHNNQAGMTFLSGSCAGIYSEYRFLLKSTAYQSIAGVVKSGKGCFGLHLNYQGDRHFNTSMITLAYARKLGYHFSAGVGLDLVRILIAEGYGKQLIPTFEAGLMVEISDKLLVGSHVFNPVQSKLADYSDERLPSVMSLGFNFLYSENLLLRFECRKVAGLPFTILTGLEYKAIKRITLRTGIATLPFRYSFGLGLDIGYLTIDIAAISHPVLGYSPGISATCPFGGK
jgi:hypothetical protein